MPWPPAADPEAAARLIDEFPAAAPALAGLLACLGGNSPYLADLARAEPGCLAAIAEAGPDEVCDQALAQLARTPYAAPRRDVAAAMRRAKRHVSLAVAVADIGGLWTLEQVTGALSDLAEAALRLAVNHLLHEAAARGELRLANPGQPARGSGFAVLGMGKLGARELNYSSDVDLVLLYDPESHPYNTDGLGSVFTRLARNLVTLMEAREAGGYVFRTDLRLRPDPGSTPPAVSLPGAIAYYESMAQTWERAAMIKARPVAGDIAAGGAFLDAIRPFVWRRHLDFAAIADIRAMKRRMDEHKGTRLPAEGAPEERVLGHDLKLGQGGIREIEFIAQTLQLVWGGRDPALRVAGTLAALHALGRAGRLPQAKVAALEQAYRFLRTAEHRLQMVQDRQTHSLPATPEELRRFSVFMSYSDPARFARDLLGHLDRVHEAYAGLFSAAAGPPDAEAPPPRIETPGETGLQAQGFRDPAQVRAVVEAWQAGRPRALRSERARLLLGDILPALLASFSRLADPDAAFARLDQMLGRLPAGVQLLSLLQHNPALLDRLADVLGAAPSLADHLASVPSAIEGLLLPQDLEPDIGALLGLQLRDAAEVDDAVAIAARLVRGEEFRLAVAELDGRIDAERAGQARTALADAAIRALLPRVMADHVRRYGRLRGGGIAVVALGKAGSREMMAGSDLDLMLVYDHPPEVTESRGARPVPPSQYYARAANAIIAALTVQTRDGPLYSVDMRLRPSGSKGPVAVSLRAFETYHAHSAWTWERMALTRARVVAGPKKLQARVRAAIAAALRHPADPATLRADAAAMRARLLHELPPEGAWDVKLRPGGLLETEFIAQTLRLLRPAQPSGPGTLAMLQAARDAGCLPEADRRVLAEADLTWRSVQGLLRIMLGRRVPRVLPVPVLDRLAAHLGMPASEPILLSQLDEVAAAVRGLFLRHVGEPGGGAKDAYGMEGRSG